MESIQVRVPWKHGLDRVSAAKIAMASSLYKAQVRLRLGGRISDAHSVLGLVGLCASLNAAVRFEADGDDEQEALKAVAACIEPEDPAMGT